MEKGCGSTIWRTYKSEVRGKPERVRRDDPTNPWVELSRKTCSNPPLEKHASDILISKAARRCTQSRGSGRYPGSGSFLATRSRTIGTNGCAECLQIILGRSWAIRKLLRSRSHLRDHPFDLPEARLSGTMPRIRSGLRRS